jgi:alkyl hydroperoxide reductase subunit D
MEIDTLRGTLPDYAKDLRLNLGSLSGITSLTEQQLYGTMLATAIASRDPEVLAAVAADVGPFLSPEATAAAKAAASLMAMNNVYYRFLHLVEQPQYATMPARLRMNLIANPGVDTVDFELWCLAVSAVNGCGSCVSSHERTVRGAGASAEMVQDVVRVASVIHAAAVTLAGERVLAPTA